MTDLAYQTIASLASDIRNGLISPTELIDTALKRIAEQGKHLHAFAHIAEDNARAQAEVLSTELAEGKYRGPLQGVPVGVKDLLATADQPTACGLSITADLYLNYDSAVVERLRAAGAVIVGKNAMTEGAIMQNPKLPEVVNPWHKDYWVGWSSSGSSASVAAGLCYGSLGTDTGGSIRLPASACGLVGLKPTWGRISRYGLFPCAPPLDHIGPLTRSATDAAIMLKAIAGRDSRDSSSSDKPVPDYVNVRQSDLHGLRIGIDRHWVTDDVDREVVKAFDDAATVLTDLGAELVDITVPFTPAIHSAFFVYLGVWLGHTHKRYMESHSAEYSDNIRQSIISGCAIPAIDYLDAENCRREFTAQLDKAFGGVDVIATPVMPIATPTTEKLYALFAGERIDIITRFTAPADLSGHPAIAFPCGYSEQFGLPMSMQLMGRKFAEENLLSVVACYEQATPWHLKRPDL